MTTLSDRTSIKLFPMIAGLFVGCGALVSFTFWIAVVSTKADSAIAYNFVQDQAVKEELNRRDSELKELKKMAQDTRDSLFKIEAKLNIK